jgi:hypothetical protein
VILHIPLGTLFQSNLPSIGRPEVIFVSQPFSWVPLAISLLQFLALLTFAIYSFRTGTRQKLRERRAAWFHKVVVDPLVVRIDTFFAGSVEVLHGAANLVDRDRVSGATVLSQDLRGEIAKFKSMMFDLAAEVSRRLQPFDPATERWASALFDNLEEEVTKWFDAQLFVKPHQRRDALDNTLGEFYTSLLRGLMQMEFRHWG